MKRFVIAICIILLFAGLSCLSLWYIDQVHDDLNAMLEQCYQYGMEDQVDEAAALSREVFEKWHAHEPLLLSFIHHNQLDEVTVATSRLAPLIENGEKGEYFAEIEKAMVLLEHIQMAEKPLLKNIL